MAQDSSKVFSVRWNNHQPNLVSYFGNLLKREAKESSFVDVTLVSKEGTKIGAHKMILASCSPYFQSIFEDHPSKHPIVILKDIVYEDLKTIVAFIYNGEVNIKQEKINSILSLATSLQVKGLSSIFSQDGDVKRTDGEQQQSELSRPHPILASTSYSSGDIDDRNSPSPGAEIPRKKLKKSFTGTASGSNSLSTNGEQSVSGGGGSFESGVGTSIYRSVDNDGSSGSSTDNRTETLSSRVSGLPPLYPATTTASSSHPIGKSQSLDQQRLDRDREVLADSELSSGGFSENQTFDEACDRTGYDIDDVADVKIEADSDGEIQFDESYGHPDNPDFSVPSSSFYQPVNFASSLKGRRPLRPLIRQPAIKRVDEPTESCGELYIEEGETNNETDNMNERTRENMREDSVSVPILTVSQSSPTPPSSPAPTSSSNDSISLSTKLFSSTLTTFNNADNVSHIGSNNSLLMVPSGEPTSVSSSSSGSSSRNSSLVKQYSQPSELPSRIAGHVVQTGKIYRQNSQPNPQTRIMSPSPIKRGTFFHILPAESSPRQNESDSSQSGSAIILDSSSLIQFVPSDGRTITISPATSIGTTKDDRDKREHGGHTSPDVTLTIKDSQDPGAAQRSSHCPALRAGPALGCNFCWNSVDECGRILRRKTKYHCVECHTNLCIVPCFYEYHEKQKAEKNRRLKMQKPSSM